jgi:glycopeptide antibiotics resistance protein
VTVIELGTFQDGTRVRLPPPLFSRRVSRWGLVASIAMVVALVCPWTDFQSHTHWSRVQWVPFRPAQVRRVDVVQNVLLFAPVGVFAAAATSSPWWWLRAAVVAAPLSVITEWTQLYSHSRFPSATDVASNVLGALAGASVVRALQRARKG